MQPERIAIIGSGISGLSAAWLLSKSCDVTLFERNYPNLTALFGYLGVKTAPTDMGLAVSTTNGGMEYSGKHLGGLFGQPSYESSLTFAWRWSATIASNSSQTSDGDRPDDHQFVDAGGVGKLGHPWGRCITPLEYRRLGRGVLQQGQTQKLMHSNAESICIRMQSAGSFL